MTFYERYAALAEKHGMDPCSQTAADLFGVTKATISSWKVKSTTPKGETVAVMADKLLVSADYLLGRTDDPTDYARRPAGSKNREIATPVNRQNPYILVLYDRLDAADKMKAEGVIQGMLMQDKYSQVLLNAAHARMDVQLTPEMIQHDERIMDDSDF